MLTLTCDRCDRSFGVESAAAGAKVACPYCGDIRTVPSPTGGAAVAGAQESGLGEQTTRAAVDSGLAAGVGGVGGVGDGGALPPRDGPEAMVMLSKPAMVRSYPLRFGGLLVGAVLGPALAAWVGVRGTGPGAAVLMWTLLGLGVVAMGTIIAWKLWTYSDRLEITTRRVRLTRGLLSRSSVEMLHRTIQDIEIEQTVWQRLLRTGTIRISNAGDEEDDIEIKDVPNPGRIRDLIDRYRMG
jgi:membrane protein YdbS with pleckstrin-like domain/ribosomal protein S27E